MTKRRRKSTSFGSAIKSFIQSTMDIREIQSVKQRFGIVGNCPKLNYAIRIAVQVASTDLTVLIMGENGSGKESFSKIIHHLGHRKHGPFIAINCGAIPEGTINSELFGHEKGAFTGANEPRKGYFEEVSEGTIFLDEIGEMPSETQTRLLRILENQEFIRVGSSKIRKADVRVVAATNIDLLKNIAEGKFREDLYYRLNIVPIHVPPLRVRGNDIELLFRKFTTDFADKHHVKPLMLSTEAKNILLRYRFPGNIRQLKNMAEQMSVLEINQCVAPETITKYIPRPYTQNLPALFSKGLNDKEDFSERDILYKVLFDMKKDMHDLKKIVLEILKDDNTDVNIRRVIDNNKDLFHNVDTPTTATKPSRNYTNEEEQSSYLLPANEEANVNAKDTIDLTNTEDVTDWEEEENLSLDRLEKKMITKALKKNSNKRKYAAKDLGISERTLYRKIKQYEIEKN